jgi:chromosome segregation protein
MRLKSLTLKGFKSFPDRTRLDFGPGVSVVVGPNGSGKSNVTDAVLWAMGEQSPLAIRGQSMQDVIFGGGRGVQARSAAEVEIVLDNSDGTVDLPLSEISIERRLDRAGEGGYRLNGARCRLAEVIEVLSDTGLGKETHSVISQGRVEAIVTSKPRDRRLLIEEAAGLGKHRKRRRRAQLKLDRTQENLDRVLDVEREARSRLRPLGRQAQAAELHERLERQLLEARWTLACEAARACGADLREAELGAARAREHRERVEAELQEVIARRGQAESALAEQTERHDALARRAYEIRSARERLALRGEQVQASALTLSERAARLQTELEALIGAGAADANAESDDADTPEAGAERIQRLEQELEGLDREREREIEREIEELRSEHVRTARRVDELTEAVEAALQARGQAESIADRVRSELREAQAIAGRARSETARVGAELAAVNQFLSSHARHGPGVADAQDAGAAAGIRALSGALKVREGYELALAAALGGRLDAVLVSDLQGANALLDRAGRDGASALLAGDAAQGSAEVPGASGGQSGEDAPDGPRAAGDDRNAPPRNAPPVAGAIRLSELVNGSNGAQALVRRLLSDAWVLERLEDVPDGFTGIATTKSGRVLFGAWGEVRQIGEGGAERVLARRNERERLIAASETAATAEHAAATAAQATQERLGEADGERAEAEERSRDAERELAQAQEAERRLQWLIEQRRAAPEQGPLAVRRAQLQGELAAERRQAERIAAERAQREQRIARLRARHAADTALAPAARRLAAALSAAGEAAEGLLAGVQQRLSEDSAAGERLAGELRSCAHREAEIQARLRDVGERVTTTEVAAQRLRDQVAEAQEELCGIAERLERALPRALRGVQAEPGERAEIHEGENEEPGEGPSRGRQVEEAATAGEEIEGEDLQPLSEEESEALHARIRRLTRRREQLGPVNPLAQEEYAQALEHVQELEDRRSDLDTALRELRTLIDDTDRQIAETFKQTFDAAARNFEELVGDVFPGGSGRLRLVRDEQTPRAVIGGQAPETVLDRASGADGAGTDAAGAGRPGEPAHGDASTETSEAAADAEAEREQRAREGEADEGMGVEIEITPAGKSTERLSLLSGGEKSMTALAFLFAVFLARPCPFYILDEVEAALDDLNLDRFLALLRRYSDRAQFIVITHQKRTMEAADWLYGVSMGGDGVSKVISRRLPPTAVENDGDSTVAIAEVA